MKDYFALLQQSRRPWLEEAGLKQKFLELSTPWHPDKCHTSSDAEKSAAAKTFAEFNAAYRCLAEPKTRLLHLLELETGTKPADVQSIPSGLADLFTGVAGLCRRVDAFLLEKTRTTSPLLQVQLFNQAQEWMEKLGALQQQLKGFRARLETQLHALDQAWSEAAPADRGALLPKIEEIYRLFSYFNRWHHQLQERLVQLSL